MTTVALIPSYQPDSQLVDVVEQLRLRGMERVVVDDGSGERYQPLFEAVRRSATVIGYGKNQGKGHALKQGLRYIRGHFPCDTVVVTVDADGQHDLDDVERCAIEARRLGTSMVLGCRSFAGDDVPLRSRIGNTLTRVVYRLASGLRVSDTQTGLRAFPAALIDFLVAIGGERYEYEMNVLLACPAHSVPIREVPIRTIYRDGNEGSHFRAVRDSLRVYAGILAFVASSLASFLVDYLLFCLLSAGMARLGEAGIVLANLIARLVSATVNFTLNRNLVFRSTSSLYAAAMRYALLALAILAGNTLGVLLLVEVLGVPALVAKLVVESCFFIASWMAQRRVVFRGKECSWA